MINFLKRLSMENSILLKSLTVRAPKLLVFRGRFLDNLCRYQFDRLPSPPPGTPGLLHRNVCPAPGLLHNRKCPGAGPISDDVPRAGHLYQLAFKHENRQHSYLGLKIKMSECPIGPGKVQKTQNAISNCLFALSP